MSVPQLDQIIADATELILHAERLRQLYHTNQRDNIVNKALKNPIVYDCYDDEQAAIRKVRECATTRAKNLLDKAKATIQNDNRIAELEVRIASLESTIEEKQRDISDEDNAKLLIPTYQHWFDNENN